MSEVAIQVENVSKQYQLGTIGSGTLYRDLQSWWARYRAQEDPNTKVGQSDVAKLGGEKQQFWALRDVSFDIKQGEIVGIIGRNGAGKSTLLKILSKITGPTSGKIKIQGRVASLLEVGTGFHPELTGRENVYLNGTILGMRKYEIDHKFDEIVEFAEIAQFIDTPVKRYSSGMYVRLAFAVAAHLDPEILVIDEVLAVGDAQFQKKCLGKLSEVSKGGKTVLFVSHNMQAVQNLCTKGMLLESGRLSMVGNVKDVVTRYNSYIYQDELSVENCSRTGGSGGIKLRNVLFVDQLSNKINEIFSDSPARLRIEADVGENYRNKMITIGVGVDTIEGTRLFTCLSPTNELAIRTCDGALQVTCYFNNLPFVPGKYLVSAAIIDSGDTLDMAEHCCSFQIIRQGDFYQPNDPTHGSLDIPCRFTADC